MPPLPLPHRRPVSVALLVVAGLSLALVASALWNPWRLTALYPVASTGAALAALTLAGASVATTVLLALTDTRRALIGLVVGLVAVPALCVGLPVLTLGGALRDRQIAGERVLATSPGYSVVAVTHPDGRTELLVRSRRGLLSREAATPLAWCPHDPFAVDLPPESVRFTDEHRVAVPLVAEEVSVTVTFDAGSLGPAETIQMCE